MLKRFRYLICAVLFLFLNNGVNGQSTEGTDFWLSFFYNGELHVTISAAETTTGVIDFPAQNYSIDFLVSPDSATVIKIPTGRGTTGTSLEADDAGIHITSSKPISVVASNSEYATADATLVYPAATLDTNFLAITYSEGNSSASQLLVVATEKNTRVEVTPTVETSEGKLPNQPYSVFLNKGESFQIRGKERGSDLSGTKIRVANAKNGKKIAVFAGTPCATVGGCTACDHLYEQILPVRFWGSKYAFVPYSSRVGDLVRVISAKNNNKVTIGLGTRTLQQGQYFDTVLIDAATIIADKQIGVMQFSRGATCDGTAIADADPFMIWLSPNEQLQSVAGERKFTFDANSSTENITKFYLNVIVPTAGKGSIKIDGANVVTGAPLGDPFKALPGSPGIEYAQLTVTKGIHQISADTSFMAYIYGFGFYESYGYLAGSNAVSLGLDFTALDGLCNGKPVKFTPQVKGYAPTSYLWRFGDGTTSTQVQPSHLYSAAGQFEVRLVVDGPFGLDSVSKFVKVLENGDLQAFAGLDTSLCYGDTLSLSASGGSIFKWMGPKIIGDSLSSSVVIAPLQSTSYIVEVKDSVCAGQDYDTVMVNVKPLPEAIIDYTRVDRSVEFIGPDTKNETYWKWDFGDRSPFSAEKSPTHNYLQYSTFTVTLLTANECGQDTLSCDVLVDDKSSTGGCNLKPTSVNLNKYGFKISPNPTTDFIEITSSMRIPQGAHFEIFNTLGVKVKRGVLTSDRINLVELSSGLYSCRIHIGESQINLPIIKN